MLRGKRVLLRSVEKRDISIFYEMWCDKDVRKYDGTYVIPPSKEYIMENFYKVMRLDKKYLSIVSEKGVVLGYITYKVVPDSKNVYELGITISKNFWNRGYGQDSIRTLLRFLFMDFAAIRVELEVLAFNLRAISCYKKCGFLHEGIKRNRYFTDGEYKDVVIMGITKNDFHNYYSEETD